MGCTVSDHGLEEMYAEEFTGWEVETIFNKVRGGKELNDTERRKFKSAMLVHFAEWDWEKGWVQQFHLGALRNNNSRMTQRLGPDTGWDSIGDFSQGRALGRFLDRLDKEDKLAKTILYNLNPADNELIATMIGNFNDGSVAGKVQFGSAWWFLDQKDGMTRQINTLSNMGLLSRFVGMLTDSRSFLSFPRHEYFRRILCNLFGEEMTNGGAAERYGVDRQGGAGYLFLQCAAVFQFFAGVVGGILLAIVNKRAIMKKIIFFCLLSLGLGIWGTGCIPPPPRQHPKPPSLGGPPPPGGPGAMMTSRGSGVVVVHHNFGNLRG